MKRPRITVRRLMIAVAVVALLVWGGMMGRRSYDYDQRARFYHQQGNGWREIATRGELRTDFALECVEYFAQLSRKYRRAAWHPWLPGDPDPHAPGYDLWVEQERRKKEVAPEPPGRE